MQTSPIDDEPADAGRSPRDMTAGYTTDRSGQDGCVGSIGTNTSMAPSRCEPRVWATVSA